jgi:hypothetical protein
MHETSECRRYFKKYCIYPKRSIYNLWHPKNKTSKEKYFTTNFIHLIHTACHILSTFTKQCHCLHLHSQCFHLTGIPQHISPICCVGYTALKNLHSHFWWDVLPCCYDALWLNNTWIFLGLWTYLNPWRTFRIFATDSVVRVLGFCVVCGLVSLSVWRFLWFSLSLVVNF